MLAADNGNPAAALIILVIGLAVFAFELYAFIDMVRRPTWAWERAGSSKTTWIVLMAVGFFLCGIVPLVMSIVWFASTRSKVENAQRQAGYGQYPQQPPPYSPSYPSGQVPNIPPPPGTGWTPPPAPGAPTAAQPWGGTTVPPPPPAPSPQGPPPDQAPPPNACASCGAAVSANASFCPNCGHATR